tara:strand:- start:3261 stop:4565 length:1305 start_codon:yes stop_codon:yes gene_type:complete
LAFGGSTSSNTLPHTHNQSLINDGGQLSETLTDMNGVTLFSLINADSTIDPDKVVMDYSTTLTDYTTPTAAAASSEATNPDVFVWDGTSTGWTLNNNGGSATIGSSKITLVANSNADNPLAYYDLNPFLGGNASDTSWTLRYKVFYNAFNNTASGQGAKFEMGLSDSTAITGETPSIDLIAGSRAAHAAGSNQNPVARYNATSCSGTQNGVVVSSPFTGTRYVQVQRTSGTTMEVKIFTDSGYSVLQETMTISSFCDTIEDLRYLFCRIHYQNVSDTNTVEVSEIKFYNASLVPVDSQAASNAIDNDVATFWESNQAVNNWIYVDQGTAKDLTSITVYPKSTTTETQFKIQWSNDTSTWTDLRTITVSGLINGAYNYIRFNTIRARYLRIYGSSGSSYVMAINEIKVNETLTVPTVHGHLEISPTDTSLSLAGT